MLRLSNRVCANCGNTLAAGSKFCKECGVQVTGPATKPDAVNKTETQVCANCGNSLAAGSKFCKECGTPTRTPVLNQPAMERVEGSPSEARTKYCQHCAARIAFEAEICPKCGVRVSAITNPKNEAIAVILSFFWMGLGQIYVGRMGRGIMLAVVELLIVLTFSSGLGVIVAFITIPLWAWSMYDAYKGAKEYDSKLKQTGKAPW